MCRQHCQKLTTLIYTGAFMLVVKFDLNTTWHFLKQMTRDSLFVKHFWRRNLCSWGNYEVIFGYREHIDYLANTEKKQDQQVNISSAKANLITMAKRPRSHELFNACLIFWVLSILKVYKALLFIVEINYWHQLNKKMLNQWLKNQLLWLGAFKPSFTAAGNEVSTPLTIGLGLKVSMLSNLRWPLEWFFIRLSLLPQKWPSGHYVKIQNERI